SRGGICGIAFHPTIGLPFHLPSPWHFRRAYWLFWIPKRRNHNKDSFFLPDFPLHNQCTYISLCQNQQHPVLRRFDPFPLKTKDSRGFFSNTLERLPTPDAGVFPCFLKTCLSRSQEIRLFRCL